MLELERLKSAQLEEMKRVQDQIESMHAKCDAEKAKIRAENGAKNEKFLQDYRDALEREQALEKKLRIKE